MVMFIDIDPAPTADQALSRVPKRVAWNKLKRVMKDLGFYDVLVHDSGRRITANLFATGDLPCSISMKRSITIHVSFTRESRSRIRSTGMLVLPSGRRSMETEFPTPRDAVVAAVKFLDHAQKNGLYKIRDGGKINSMDWDD